MNKDVFKSFNYSLLTNYKKYVIDSIGYDILRDIKDFSLSSQDIMALLVVEEESCDKPEMSAEELSLFESAASNLSDDVSKGAVNKISYDCVCELLRILTQKRVSNDYNVANCLNLADIFVNVEGFDAEVLKEILLSDEEVMDESLYSIDSGLRNLYCHRLANEYISNTPITHLIDSYMARREAYAAMQKNMTDKGYIYGGDNHKTRSI